MTDRSDAFGYVFDPAHGPRRRVLFEPRADGGWFRIEAVWTGCRWREIGREPVRDVAEA